jgi:DNA modification methylase
MKGFPEESIDMVMFSPPYWGLRDYGEGTETVWGGSSDCRHEWVKEVCGLVHENRNNLRGSQEEVVGKTGTAWIRKYDQKTVGFCVKCGAWRGQLGLEPNSQMYIAHMVEVCREIKRVLKKTGSVYIVLGDTFMNKQKLGIPWCIRFALNEDGWISRSDIVWHKPNAMPSSVKDRLNTTYEMIFHFVKHEKYYYNLDAIREPHTSLKDLGRRRLDTRTPKHDLAVRLGAGSIGPSGYLVQHPLGKNPGDIVQTKLEGLDIQELIREVYRRLSRNEETYEGKNRLEDVNAKRIRAFDGRKIREAARQILRERQIPHSTKLVEFIHDHFSHPLGKNPGDVMDMTKHDLAVGRVGNFGYADPLHVKEYHPKGKNPGDIIRSRTDRRLIQDRPLRPPHHPFRGDGWEGINPDMKPHPKGKNPGDVIQERTWQRAEEYHRKQGKLRSNGTVAGHYLDLLDVAKHYNSKGKNPGDIVKIAEEKGRPLNPPHHAERKKASDIDRMVYSGGFYHDVGKNPGDIVEDFSGLMNEVMKIYSKVTDVEIQEWGGKACSLDPQQNFRRLALNERKSRVRFEIALDKLGIQDNLRRKLIAHWHNHSTHPLGKNPGDIIKWSNIPGQARQGNFGHGGTHGNRFNHPEGKNPGDYWNVCTKPFKGAHFAVYPEEICVKPILSSCPSNGIVLDPMCGSGTTLAVAKKLGRRFIGIEINPNYVNIATRRLLRISPLNPLIS